LAQAAGLASGPAAAGVVSRDTFAHTEAAASGVNPVENDGNDPKDLAIEPVERDAGVDRGIAPLVKVGIVFGMLCGALALLWFSTTADDAFVYSKLVDEVMTHPDAWKSRPVRVEGDLKQGSIEFREHPCEYRFVIGTKGHEMPVRFAQCIVPDTFKDGMGLKVTVQGKLNDEGYFAADQVIPRCPSKYEMDQAAKRGEKMPHSMPVPPRATGDGV
jgi:cytochrome c-type biogenesis protein CcmE